jgi:hypothetical protein
MMIARLESERQQAKRALEHAYRTTRSNNDPLIVHMKKTLNSFDSLLGRIDAVLVDAAEAYPNIFDFASDTTEAPDLRLPPGVEATPPGAIKHGEDARSASAKAMAEWAGDLAKKGYLSKEQADRERARFEAFKRVFHSDESVDAVWKGTDSLAEARDRTEWAEQMFKKGYLPRSQLEAARQEYERWKRRSQPKSDSTPCEPPKAIPDENRADPFAKPDAPQVDSPKTSPF